MAPKETQRSLYNIPSCPDMYPEQSRPKLNQNQQSRHSEQINQMAYAPSEQLQQQQQQLQHSRRKDNDNNWNVDDIPSRILSDCLPNRRLQDQGRRNDLTREEIMLSVCELDSKRIDTSPSARQKSSPLMYHRSLSTTMLEPMASSRGLVSLPPVRRDPRMVDHTPLRRDSRYNNNPG